MPTPGPRGRRAQLGVVMIGVAVVLILSSVSWFSSGRSVVGVVQLAIGGVLACAVIVWPRLERTRRR